MTTINSKVLHQYQNGNVQVTVYEDGTKTREWPDGEDQNVEFPESCDLKITQYCDLDKVCVFCHEMSDKKGKHGDLDLISKIWANQKAGTELAIGGGNPLAHPQLDSFLARMGSQGILPNLTVNNLHVKRHEEQLRALQANKFIYGLGISYRGPQFLKDLPTTLDYNNTVFHLILGINSFSDCMSVIRWSKERGVKPKILLLGYKQFGKGADYYSPELQKKINKWHAYLSLLLQIEGLTLSFDNLAIKQLQLNKVLGKEQWDTLFQGPDQTHTFYVDAIEKTVAGTSTSEERFPITADDTVVSIFNKVKLPWTTQQHQQQNQP